MPDSPTLPISETGASLPPQKEHAGLLPLALRHSCGAARLQEFLKSDRSVGSVLSLDRCQCTWHRAHVLRAI